MKPIENRDVVGVASTKYPLNNICAHPECTIKRDGRKGAHHIFPRSLITNDSYFVRIHDPSVESGTAHWTIPHVTWLCPDHHEDVEIHRAWIKWEDEQFVWYERERMLDTPGVEGPVTDSWGLIGPLDPQPATGEKKRKRSKRLKGQAKRNKINVTLKVPNEEREDGAGLYYDAVEQLEEILGYDPPRSAYYTIMDALNIAILHGKEDIG